MTVRTPNPGLALLLWLPLGLVGSACGLVSDEGETRLLQNQNSLRCDQLDETACLTRQDCVAVYGDAPSAGRAADVAPCACDAVVCEPGEDCSGNCSCPTPPPPTFVSCEAANPCAGLDEQACIDDPECQPIYDAGGPCPAIACPPGSDCPVCDTSVTYAGCESSEIDCPAVLCELYCPYGFATDTNGCETCGCLPPPSGCEGLDEQACLAAPNCMPGYSVEPCACETCGPGENCAPCYCPEEPVYDGCFEVDGCSGLDEQACIQNPACEPLYVGVGCVCPGCAPGQNCPPCECEDDLPEVSYAGCAAADPCVGLDENACIAAPWCTPIYGDQGCGQTAGDPDDGAGLRAPPPCEAPSSFQGCISDPNICPAVACDVYCPYGQRVAPNGCETCECNPPPGPCDNLDEQLCVVTPGCEPIYGYNGGTSGGSGDAARPCACPDCPPDAICEPCDCGAPAPPYYLGCVESDPCAGLDEWSCLSAPSCQPIYGGSGCICPECPPDATDCPGVCDCAPPVEEYYGCESIDPCQGLDENACHADPSCWAEYIETCDGGGNGFAPCSPDVPECDPPQPTCTTEFYACHS